MNAFQSMIVCYGFDKNANKICFIYFSALYNRLSRELGACILKALTISPQG
jgi:hypothetical protein